MTDNEIEQQARDRGALATGRLYLYCDQLKQEHGELRAANLELVAERDRLLEEVASLRTSIENPNIWQTVVQEFYKHLNKGSLYCREFDQILASHGLKIGEP